VLGRNYEFFTGERGLETVLRSTGEASPGFQLEQNINSKII
jgi:hypothetical protein